MNEANSAVRDAAHDVAVEILGALGVQPQENGYAFRRGIRGGRHRTEANTVCRGHLGASKTEAICDLTR